MNSFLSSPLHAPIHFIFGADFVNGKQLPLKCREIIMGRKKGKSCKRIEMMKMEDIKLTRKVEAGEIKLVQAQYGS